MTRSRNYRLFEVNVEHAPQTPSAHRVRVQSSPVASSPLRFLTNLITPESAESRAHPDKTRDVWELSVWDPLPVSLRLFCLFSPGHLLVYMLFLPLVPLDPRPSVTVFNCLILQAILSAQLIYLQSRYSQQIKDTAIIHKEVLHEYDTKFVHPRIHPVVRDVGTQMTTSTSTDDEFVELGTPTTQIRREFHTHPNPNYMKHIDPEDEATPASSNTMSPRFFTPSVGPRKSDSFMSATSIRATPMRQSLPAQTTPAVPPSSAATSTSVNFGGNLGVYSHMNSPLKKATSMNDMNSGFMSPRNSREMAAVEQREAAERMRRSSPVKQTENRRQTMSSLGQQATTNPFTQMRRDRYLQERYPSRI
jgi:hypothetical protein